MRKNGKTAETQMLIRNTVNRGLRSWKDSFIVIIADGRGICDLMVVHFYFVFSLTVEKETGVAVKMLIAVCWLSRFNRH